MLTRNMLTKSRYLLLFMILLFTACAPAPQIPAMPVPITIAAPATLTTEPIESPTLPFVHTACAEGVDLTGRTFRMHTETIFL